MDRYSSEQSEENTTSPWLQQDAGNVTADNHPRVCQTYHPDTTTIAFLLIYLLIFLAGIIGNGLVIIVIQQYKQLKSVTNLYILNLSVADTLFLLALPLTICVGVLGHWVFGAIMCKVFFILDCVNKFMSAFILTLMAGDRYLAACHPISSLTYRKTKYAASVLCCVWILAFIVMSPAIYYAGIVPGCTGTYLCVIQWPKDSLQYSKVFTAYTMLLGFVLPVICICILYAMIIARLRRGGPGRSAHNKNGHFRKATRLVTLVICVFIACWLPHWSIQVIVLFINTPAAFRCYQVFTALSYTNSALNPLLYGATNQTFREAFYSVFHCRSAQVPMAGARTDA